MCRAAWPVEGVVQCEVGVHCGCWGLQLWYSADVWEDTRHRLTLPTVERPALLQKWLQPLKCESSGLEVSRRVALVNQLLTSAALQPRRQIRLSAGSRDFKDCYQISKERDGGQRGFFFKQCLDIFAKFRHITRCRMSSHWFWTRFLGNSTDSHPGSLSTFSTGDLVMLGEHFAESNYWNLWKQWQR